jgi:hypothetical protein
MGEKDEKEIGEGAMGSSSKQSERTDEEDITLDSRDSTTSKSGNRVVASLKGVAQKASDASKGAVARVKQISPKSASTEEPADVKETDPHDVKNVATSTSEHSKMSKVTNATKKTLSKPLNATKKIITSTGSAMHLKKKTQKLDSTVSEISTFEDNEDASDEYKGKDDTDTAAVGVSNSTHFDPAKDEANEDAKTAVMINVGPFLSFLFHDATIAIGSSLLIAAFPTFSNLDLIRQNQIPLSASLTWLIVAFIAGYEVALFRFMPTALGEEEDFTEDLTIPSEINVPIMSQPKRGYSILRRVSTKLPKGLKIQMPKKIKAENLRSALATKRGEQFRWQRSARAKVSEPLMKRLLRNPMYQRKPEVESMVDTVSSEDGSENTKMGAFALPDADSLRQDVVEPLFRLRGMDIFMTEELEGGAEDNMSMHPFLVENGLRDTPSFVVNMMSQYANILIYFEMPSWLKDWDNIVEEEDDPDDVKALKRFLNGNDEYKDLRLKMLPYVVDGPYPIKVLSPPKKEVTINCALLPTKWHQHEGETRTDGRYLYPCLELELDLMATKVMRGFASLVKRYLSKMLVDVAVTIDKPDLQQEEELSACIGMWRFDKVDISHCPNLPNRLSGRSSVQADTIRASILMQQTELDLQVARQELLKDSLPRAQAVAAA